MHAELPSSSSAAAGGSRRWLDLPRDLLADIRGRLRFTDRLFFTAVFGDLFFPEAPWLVLPEDTFWHYRTTFFSLADRRAASLRLVPLPKRNNDILLGSSGGWLAMADKEGLMHLVNPVTGQKHALPAITSMVGLKVISFLDHSIKWFIFDKEDFLAIRFGARPERRPIHPSCKVWTFSGEMGNCIYHKVALSASARPSSYAAMLILTWRSYSVPAFATAEDPTWRLAAPRDDVLDAVHHRGRFYSVGRCGVVEAWDEKKLTSKVVASRLAGASDKQLVTTPEGRLVAVFRDAGRYLPGSSSNVQMLDDASHSWQETDNIGQAAVLVGAANSIMCVSTREHQNLTDNCIYFTDEVKQEIRVYSLQHRTLTKIEEFGVVKHLTYSWKGAAWFTPSFR